MQGHMECLAIIVVKNTTNTKDDVLRSVKATIQPSSSITQFIDDLQLRS